MSTPFDEAAARVAAGADPEVEAAALVAAATLEEKLGCLDGDIDAWPGLADMTSGGYHDHPWPAAAVPRLGIPGIAFSDGPRGVVIGEATCFPVSMARGASFDVELEAQIGEVIGAELRAVDATYYGGVCVNLLRHPGWGRAQETYGEDPHHVGELGAALCRGVQRHALACVKHFACNSMENARFRVDVTVDDRALHEVYLPHFKRVVDEGVASVMSAYNQVNGEWCGESRALLTDVLRGEWGFDGFVITDFIFGLRDAVASVRNGLDIEMPFRQLRGQHLPGALADGRLEEADLDPPATRVVATLLRFAAVLEPPAVATVLAAPAHRALARRAAEESIVLLRNEGPLLPVEPSRLGRVAVLGRLAAVANVGDRGSSEVIAPEVVTVLDGLRAALPSVTVEHHDEDAGLAADADLAVVVVGCTHADEGEFIDPSTTGELFSLLPPMPEPAAVATEPPAEPRPRREPRSEPAADRSFAVGGDRVDLGLSSADDALVRAVAAANPRTVVVLMGGSAILTTGWDELVPAIAHAWYPGMEGGHAVAAFLTGAVDPSGRLPFAVPARAEDLVDFDRDASAATYGLLHGQWWLDHQGVAPAWPYGWGLSYTSFALSDLAVALDGGEVVADVTLTNTGERPGADVTFLFAGLPGSAVLRPRRRLAAFARTELAPGEARRLRLTVPVDRLAVRLDHAWTVEPGAYKLTAARFAGDPAGLVATMKVEGR